MTEFYLLINPSGRNIGSYLYKTAIFMKNCYISAADDFWQMIAILFPQTKTGDQRSPVSFTYTGSIPIAGRITLIRSDVLKRSELVFTQG